MIFQNFLSLAHENEDKKFERRNFVATMRRNSLIKFADLSDVDPFITFKCNHSDWDNVFASDTIECS